MQTAWMKAIEQKERADLAVRFLEVDNATLRADIEASKLSASESMEMCLRAMVREKNHLKKLASWQKQRAKLQEGIAVENQKLLELQEEMLQVEAAKKTAEAKWREEQKAKEHALSQVEEQRRLREATKVNKKRNDETSKLVLQCYKDDLQRFEQELAHIKTSACRNQHSSNPSASRSQDETSANLLHESYDLDEKEDEIDRECINLFRR